MQDLDTIHFKNRMAEQKELDHQNEMYQKGFEEGFQRARQRVMEMIDRQDVRDFLEIGSIPWCVISDDQKKNYECLCHKLAYVLADKIYFYVK